MLNYDAIILDLKNALQLDLAFNEEGVCELLMDESRVISIVQRKEDNALTLASVIAEELPDPVNYHLVLDLLEFSLGAAIHSGPAIGRDPEKGLLIAYQSVVPSLLKEQNFMDVFFDFIAFCEGMSRIIEENKSVEDREQTEHHALKV